MIISMIPAVTATPAAAAIPMKNGDRWFNGLLGGPRGWLCVLSCAAVSSATATGPSASVCGCATSSWCPPCAGSPRVGMPAGDPA